MSKSEHQEQTDFFFKARKHFRDTNQTYLRNLLFAIPNGGKRGGTKAEAVRLGGALKMEGVLAGVPDIFFAHPSPSAYGLFIELKVVSGGTVSPEQKKMIAALREEGYVVEVCLGADAAYKVLLDYLGDRI